MNYYLNESYCIISKAIYLVEYRFHLKQNQSFIINIMQYNEVFTTNVVIVST